ncbi:hypothetical protein FGO68_gene4726 [Halteria grandinella]|uniref:Uncharacterized protein n=1 Tax=Halteria grandinella TaxID=5974 RepID=A0A8J8T2Q5_HALGN|nr:hypothetical protein FGO68_gene4726 [Halteria grandinella]
MNKNCSVLLSSQQNSISEKKEERKVGGTSFFTLKPQTRLSKNESEENNPDQTQKPSAAKRFLQSMNRKLYEQGQKKIQEYNFDFETEKPIVSRVGADFQSSLTETTPIDHQNDLQTPSTNLNYIWLSPGQINISTLQGQRAEKRELPLARDNDRASFNQSISTITDFSIIQDELLHSFNKSETNSQSNQEIPDSRTLIVGSLGKRKLAQTQHAIGGTATDTFRGQKNIPNQTIHEPNFRLQCLTISPLPTLLSKFKMCSPAAGFNLSQGRYLIEMGSNSKEQANKRVKREEEPQVVAYSSKQSCTPNWLNQSPVKKLLFNGSAREIIEEPASAVKIIDFQRAEIIE